MLDGLLNRGFSSRCKSIGKALRARIEVVRRRAGATQKFLKEDLAKLLANGHDINAYGRTEEFLAGLNLLSCYDFIEYACEFVVKQLSSMQKQRECPEECREPVASLMFAAARFSDLPELRDLRDLLQERYGCNLECFVNQKFVEKLSSRPVVMEKKLQLLKDIASEFSINWDLRGFEQRMAAAPKLAQAQSNKRGPSACAADKYNLLNGNGSVPMSDRYDVSLKEIQGSSNGGPRIHSAREGKNPKREDGSVAAKYDRHDVSPDETHCLRSGGHRMHNGAGAKESKRIDGGVAVAQYDRYDVSPEETRGLSNDGHRMHNVRDKDSRREDASVAVAKFDRYDVSPKQTCGLSNDGHRMHYAREGQDSRREELDLHLREGQGSSINGHISSIKKGENNSRRVKNDLLFEGRQELMVDKLELSCQKNGTLFKAVKSGSSSRRKGQDNIGSGYSGEGDGSTNIHEAENLEALSHGKTKMSSSCGDSSSVHVHVREKNIANSKRILQEEGVDSLNSSQNALLPPPYIKSKNNVIPPPYVKPKDHKHRHSRKSEQEGSSCDGHSVDPSSHNRVKEENGSNRIQRAPENPEGQTVGLGRVRSHRHQKDQYYQDDKIPLPKPRSTRRKQHRSTSDHDDVSHHVEDAGAVKRSSSSRRRDDQRKGLQILFDDEHSRKDEEERIIDKLLLHYSKKPSTYGGGKQRKNSRAHPSHQTGKDTGESSHDQIKDVHDLSTDIIPTTVRSISLPREETKPSETKKVFTRANSFQPDGQARHVHPKLPDYDDLAARFAALKGG